MASSRAHQEPWLRLWRLWEASPEEVATGVPHELLAPAWQLLLQGDGSPTRQLALLTGRRTEVEVLDMADIGDEEDGAPPGIELIAGPRVRRQVWLTSADGARVGYAASWWNAADAEAFFGDPSQPIGRTVASARTELYRELKGLYLGSSAGLAAGFGAPGPFWGRHYVFWRDGRPLTLIYEVFSPALAAALGPPSQPFPPPLGAEGEVDHDWGSALSRRFHKWDPLPRTLPIFLRAPKPSGTIDHITFEPPAEARHPPEPAPQRELKPEGPAEWGDLPPAPQVAAGKQPPVTVAVHEFRFSQPHLGHTQPHAK